MHSSMHSEYCPWFTQIETLAKICPRDISSFLQFNRVSLVDTEGVLKEANIKKNGYVLLKHNSIYSQCLKITFLIDNLPDLSNRK